MAEIYLPDYKGGSIVNLMSSIASACNGRNSYPNLRYLSFQELKKYKNIILIVIDGLGYEFLKKQGISFLLDNTRSSITSVFLPTTASAITTFLTGEAVQQHAVTGWFVYLKELGMTTKILPFAPRTWGKRFDKKTIPISKIINELPFGKKIKRKYYAMKHKHIFDSQFTNYTCQNSKKIKYFSLNQMLANIIRVARKKEKKYIYSYWSRLDSLEHELGTQNSKVKKHFRQIDKTLEKFIKRLKRTNSIVIITADHGLVTTPKNKVLYLKNHSKLNECLSQPFSGEGRMAYCYVHPNKAKQFEDYVKIKLSKYCHLHKSEDLINKNYFGLGKPNPRLFDRVGDYILMMKYPYIIKDKLLGEFKEIHLGNHGGVSKEEMLVPLIVLKC